MEKENNNPLKEIKPFLVNYLAYAHAVIEARNSNKRYSERFISPYDKEQNEKFASKFNSINFPQRYKFISNNGAWVWIYKRDSVELKITIVKITKNAVILECDRNGKFKIIEIEKIPLENIYFALYQFLIETTVKADVLVSAEAVMNF